MEPSPTGEPEWASTVVVLEDPGLATELVARLPPRGAPRSVSVTELLDERRAFYRLVHGPVPASPEREAKMEAGRRAHRRAGPVLSELGELEVRVRRGGIHGRIDLLADVPVEVKTSTTPAVDSDPREVRRDHVAQLALYASLLGTDRGRLLYLESDGERFDQATAHEFRFESGDRLRSRMEARAEALREASRLGTPEGLARCAWFERGCEFRAAGVCDCRGTEEGPSGDYADAAVGWTLRPELAASLTGRLRALPSEPGPLLLRFRDLLYPRRAYFERVGPPLPPEAAAGGPREVSDTYGRVAQAVEGGPVGEVQQLVTRSEEPDEEVGGWRGDPYLLRTSKAWSRVDPESLLARFPQYALELGFRCVATGRREARVVIGYERAERDPDVVQVLHLRFRSPSTFSTLWRQRRDAYARALSTHRPETLRACPGWMVESCPYRESCGCGEAGGRSQR